MAGGDQLQGPGGRHLVSWGAPPELDSPPRAPDNDTNPDGLGARVTHTLWFAIECLARAERLSGSCALLCGA